MSRFCKQFIFLGLGLILLTPSSILAYQEVTAGGDLVATVSPADPGPNTRVTISLRAYGIDIDNSLITWGLDGKMINSSFGLKNFAFQTGALGSRTIVSIDVAPRSQDSSIKKILVFEPLDLELDWQSATSRPYWYQGRNLVTPESVVTVSALVTAVDQSGKTIPPETLVYKWTKNDKVLEAQSGIGRSNLSYTAAKKGADQIGLTLVTPNGNATTKTISIPVLTPKISFYIEQPLIGTIFQQQLGSEQSLADNLALRAEAFGFSADPLSFNWVLGQETITPKQDDPGLMYFAVKSKQPINQRVDLNIGNSNKDFQSGVASLFLISNKNQPGF